MCLRLFIFVVGYHIVTGEVNLTVSDAGNCGDNTVLTCRYTAASCSAWAFRKNSVLVSNNAVPVTDKYEGSVEGGQQTITLTIKNMEMADVGNYTCTCEFTVSTDKQLLFECKPTAVTKRIRQDKRFEINFNQVYPNPASVSVTVNSSPQPGTYTCTGSTNTYYNCTWTSSSSLEDVDGGYRVVVKTVTETPLSGFIKIVTPGPPGISNREQLPGGRSVIRGTEDSQVALTCVSSGGIPVPTVVWYRDSISTTPLKSISTMDLQVDSTYRVTLTHSITAHRSDDLRTFVCRSYYPQATSTVTQGSQETSVLLYLNWPPDKPTHILIVTTVHDGPLLLWEPGFDGGRNQTFVIQTSEDGVNWINNTQLNVGTSKNYLLSSLKNIQSSTLFFVRMFSYNTNGRSVFSDVLNFTSYNAAIEDNDACINQGELIGGVFGSLLVGILLGLGIFFLFGRYRTCNTSYLKSGSHNNLSVKLQKRERVEISPRENTNQDAEPGELIAGDQAIGLSPVTYEELSKIPGEDKQHYESLNTSGNPDKVYYNIQD